MRSCFGTLTDVEVMNHRATKLEPKLTYRAVKSLRSSLTVLSFKLHGLRPVQQVTVPKSLVEAQQRDIAQWSRRARWCFSKAFTKTSNVPAKTFFPVFSSASSTAN